MKLLVPPFSLRTQQNLRANRTIHWTQVLGRIVENLPYLRVPSLRSTSLSIIFLRGLIVALEFSIS
jgi:hypothetical protein